ncbi:hypothetical protein QOT17_015169 [Balamuthia mandrillaris]
MPFFFFFFLFCFAPFVSLLFLALFVFTMKSEGYFFLKKKLWCTSNDAKQIIIAAGFLVFLCPFLSFNLFLFFFFHTISHALANYDKQPIQKYGTQAAVPTKAIIYKCGDKHDKGKTFLVKNVRTLEQFQANVAKDLKMLPALRGLYTPEGKKIQSLEEIEDKAVLVAVQKGFSFDAKRLPTALTQG